MGDIKRYEFCWDINGAEIVESKYGRYVEFDDHEAEIDKWINKYTKLVQTLQYSLSILESIQPEQLEILENDLDELVDFQRIYSLLNELGEEYPQLRVKEYED